MTLLYPIGLLALAGLIIPVLIHLWSVKQGKVLKIGSIALLGENATASSKSIKLTDILLFILRCLLIILIAFLLAQPYLKTTFGSKKNTGWILIDKAQAAKAYQQNKGTIDSLLNIGYEIRDFNLGFSQFTLKDSIAESTTVNKLNYTALLHQLNTQIPTGYSAYVFADRRLVNFDGNMPKASFKLLWKELQTSDTIKTWTTKFLDKVYEGKSTSNLTSYSSSINQDLPTIRAVIYEPNGNDAKYIRAALNAIADFTKRKIEIVGWNSISANKADVLFWLSEQPVTTANLKKGSKLFTYQKGKTIAVNSTLLNIELKKRIASDGFKGLAVWTDGFGEPILVKESNASLSHYHFYSRFNPQWTELVWNEQFVKALVPLVLDSSNDADFGFEDHDADQRVLAKEQIFVANMNATTKVLHINAQQDLSKWVWVLAFMVLIIERFLSLRRKTNVGYVKN